MKRTLIWVTAVCCLLTLAVAAQAQVKQKAGLWEVTSQMTMSGMSGMPGMGPQTHDVCVTQAMIDKYGGPYSNPQNGQCQTSDVVVTPTGMSAKVSCTGRMSMTGTVQATFVDANTTKSTIQMTMTMGNGQTMSMTTQMTSTYKGADCGSVQPIPMPSSQ